MALTAPTQAQARRDAQPEGAAPPLEDTVITVLASGEPEPLVATGEQVSVFDRAEIELVQGADLTRLLERSPGVTISRAGGPGTFTALRVRGAEAEQVLVLVDGVRMADPAAPAAGFDLGTLAMGNLARVELQRGSNSTIWGSQAIGGVLAASTLAPEGPQVSTEFGSYDTLYARGGAGFTTHALAASMNSGYLRSHGFSAAEAGSEPDGYRQWELVGRARARINQGLSAFGHMRLADARLEIDGFPAPTFVLADTDEYQKTHQLSGALGLEYVSADASLRAIYSQADTERENHEPSLGRAPSIATDGTSRRAELRGRTKVIQDLALHFGAEREWLSFGTSFEERRDTAIWGTYVQADYDRDSLNLAIGLRRDEHRDFGGAWSLGADASLTLSRRLRLTASYGEGFKAPSLFQLLSDFGNPALEPETSRSVDAGIEAQAGFLTLALTAFRRDTQDQIAFVSCFGVIGGICTGRPFGTYDNITRTRAQGIEAELTGRLTDRLTLEGVYTLIDAEDRSTGAELARRPRHAATISAIWQPLEALDLAADLRIVSRSFDDPDNLVPLAGYQVLTFRGAWTLSEAVQLFARVENLWDEDYQTAAGYGTAGRSAFAGARLNF